MRVFPVVLSSPSGGGKTTIAKRLLSRRADVSYSISSTTRRPRAGEVDGRDYHFWTEEQFDEAIARGEFAEWAVVHDRRYGTLLREVDRGLASGRHVVLDIDVQGAAQLATTMPGAVRVFILPPSADALVARLGGRRSEDEESLKLRIQNASAELLQVAQYDYVVVNEEIEAAVSAVESIIEAESLRRARLHDLDDRIASLRAGLDQRLAAQSRRS